MPKELLTRQERQLMELGWKLGQLVKSYDLNEQMLSDIESVLDYWTQKIQWHRRELRLENLAAEPYDATSLLDDLLKEDNSAG